MADPLKTFFNPELVRTIARMVRGVWRGFPEQQFIQLATDGLDRHELVARAGHIAGAMKQTLPADFARAVGILNKSLGPIRVTTEGDGMAPFLYLPHCIYVMEHGQGHFAESMEALKELTMRFSSEFPIRPFLQNHSERTWMQLEQWTRDPNVHVRRLVSEGTRPRLPWAPRVPGLVENPARALRLLELLKDDPELYVRRSVANQLNDVAKDHPDVVLMTCARWMKDASDERAWMVGHALRTLVKKGDPEALRVLGFGTHADVVVEGGVEPGKIKIGETLRVRVTVRNASKKVRRVVVDLGVHFVKANGGTARKVFKGKDLQLAAGEATEFTKSISFRQHSTRTHYAGRHKVDALLNGEAIALGHVDVRAPG